MPTPEVPDRLMIPGPINYEADVLEAMSNKPFGHRGPSMPPILDAINDNLLTILGADKSDYATVVSGGSGTYALEMAVRSWGEQDDDRQILVPSIGAFGDLWADICEANSVAYMLMRYEDGKVVNPSELDNILAAGTTKAVALTHNDTSTGTLNPLPELAQVIKKHGVLLFVDAVSSAGGVALDASELGIDFLATAPQKSLGVPPGLMLATVKSEALAMVTKEKRGYITDVLNHISNHEQGTTLTTPPEAQMGALAIKLAQIVHEEGLQERFARHTFLRDVTHDWADDQGFKLLPKPKHSSPTVSCFVNDRGIDLGKAFEELWHHRPISYEFDKGHGKLARTRAEKGLPDTFRVPHMGDLQPGDLLEYLDDLTQVFKQVGTR